MSNVAAILLALVAASCIAAGDCKIGRRLPAPRARVTPQDAAAPPLYTNAWAVEVEGGEKVADELAAKYGFINKGQVSWKFCKLSIMHTVLCADLFETVSSFLKCGCVVCSSLNRYCMHACS